MIMDEKINHKSIHIIVNGKHDKQKTSEIKLSSLQIDM